MPISLSASTSTCRSNRSSAWPRRVSASFALCLAAQLATAAPAEAPPGTDAQRLLIVDCLVPGQVRQLGPFATGVSPRHPRKLPAYECERVGGEYAVASRDPKAALALWLPFAQNGDAQAQTEVGELYERGLGAITDHSAAAHWYRQAADKGDTRAMVNLASLYERGLGVARDADQAAQWFRRASGLKPAPARLSIHLVEPLIVLPLAAADGTASPIELSGRGQRREITGRITTDAGVREVKVNDQAVAVDAQGVFRATLDLSAGPTPVRISAIDAQGHSTALGFTAVATDTREPARPETARAAAPDYGAYHALIIANAAYRHWPRLDTPLRDAQDLKTLLERRYGFQVTLVSNATRREVFAAFDAMRGRLTARDNLLVYYAGHGDIDPVTQRGYWVPVDGERRNRSKSISVVDVTDQLNAMPAKQVLVVADSCYSGTMARSSLPAADAELAPAARLEALGAMSRLRARVALTSGGLEPVVDGGGGANSLFARSLLDVLKVVPEPIEARRVHDELAAAFSVRARKLRLNQRPDYAPIRFAGHEAGDFVFVPRR
jgi:uncharacterized protein